MIDLKKKSKSFKPRFRNTNGKLQAFLNVKGVQKMRYLKFLKIRQQKTQFDRILDFETLVNEKNIKNFYKNMIPVLT